MDISTITDVAQLKALAYDEIASRDQAQQNLNLLNERIAHLLQNPPAVEGEVVEPKTNKT